MKVPYRWLLELAPVEATAEAIADRLTMLGIEVAEVSDPAKGLDGVVAADLVAVRPHPNADRLTLCTVNTGEATLEVVCGASNMKAGDKVVFAPIGQALPNGLELKPVKIRGVASHGMLCAEDELGLSDDHSGILILDPATPAGTPAAQALGLDDPVIEVELTTNRGDCLSMVGIAREVAAAFGVPLRLPSIDIDEAPEAAEGRASIRIDDADLADRYIGRIIDGVRIGPSPEWLRRRLEQCGIRSINNIVDVTNYVLLELGHPLHAFDIANLAGPAILVRRAKAGETLTTLDGVERRLSPENLVIADAEKPVALAGVMGGANSEVTEATRTILLESARFDPVSIRRTARGFGLSTEASYRFERGTDFHNVQTAVDRCAKLLAEIGGGRVLRGRIDCRPKGIPKPVTVAFRPSRANRLLGAGIPAATQASVLQQLGFGVDGVDGAGGAGGETWTVTVPPWRNDCALEADLIEEVARFHGYNTIRGSLPQGRPASTGGDVIPFEVRLRKALCGLGLTEIITSSFMDPNIFGRLNLPAEPAVALANPMAATQSHMRTRLLPGLLRALSDNQRNGNLNVAAFEIGHVYRPAGGPDPEEHQNIGLLSGGWAGKDWDRPERVIDFFDLKGVVEALAGIFDMALTFERSDRPFLHPGRSAEVLREGQAIGYCGELHPSLAEAWDLRGGVTVAEFPSAPFRAAWSAKAVQFAAPSVYPSSVRDIAILVGRDVPCAELAKAIRKSGGPELESVAIFDQYVDPRLGEDKRSLAFRLVFRSSQGTLKDEDVNKRYERVLRGLEQQFGAERR